VVCIAVFVTNINSSKGSQGKQLKEALYNGCIGVFFLDITYSFNKIFNSLSSCFPEEHFYYS